MKKRIVSMLMAVLMAISVISTTALATAKEITDELQDPLEIHNNEFYINQMDSIRIYNQLLQDMKNETQAYSNYAESIYPSYYGGAYIDNQTGNLIVLVTDLPLGTHSQISTFAQDYASVQFKTCAVSYNQILDAIEILSDNIDLLESRGVHIDTIRDDVLNNCVVVDVQDSSSEKIETIKSIANFEFLHFQDSNGLTFDSTIRAGSGIYNVDTNNALTFGFAAELRGKPGFVTAGHAVETIGDQFATDDADEILIGTASATAWYNRSTADAAFIEANRGIIPSNLLVGSGDLWGASSWEFPIGTTIFMRGARSGLTSGTLQSRNATSNHEGGVKLYHQWYGTYTARGGDSGAPVMTYDGNFDGPRYILIGIHSGRNTQSQISYFSPYENIVDELGITFVEDD